MARRKDHPETQKRKGYPRKRRRETDAALKAIEAKASDLADAPATTTDPWAAPAIFAPRRFNGVDLDYTREVEIWRDITQTLRIKGLLERQFRDVLARYCVTAAAWEKIEAERRSASYTQTVDTVAGGTMIRKNPVFDIAAAIEDQLNYYAEQIGLTPKTFYPISKEAYAYGQLGQGHLFDRPPGVTAAPTAPAPTAPAPAAGPLNLDDLDSPPPRSTH